MRGLNVARNGREGAPSGASRIAGSIEGVRKRIRSGRKAAAMVELTDCYLHLGLLCGPKSVDEADWSLSLYEQLGEVRDDLYDAMGGSPLSRHR